MSIMVTDRILYSQHVYLSGRKTAQTSKSEEEMNGTLTKDSAAAGNFYGGNSPRSTTRDMNKSMQVVDLSTLKHELSDNSSDSDSFEGEAEHKEFSSYQ